MSEQQEQLTVGALRKLLEQYPDDMPVAFSQYSEYAPMEARHIGPGDVFDNGGYLSHAYRSRDKARVRTHLLFPGN